MSLNGNPTLNDPDFVNPPSNPLPILQKWLEKAEALGIKEPKGMVLATVNSAGHPSSRTVLIKECNDQGVVFVTSQNSMKGRDLESNHWVSATLWWRETIQQINFQGQVLKLSDQKSDELFQARPRPAQAIAANSQQSSPLINEQELRDKVTKLINSNEKINRPEAWHAYQINISSIEFWIGNKDRFHQRLRYDLIDDTWHHQRLQP